MSRFAGILLSTPLAIAMVAVLYTFAPAATPEAPTNVISSAVSEARCGRCGDGVCVPSCGETAETCPADCGGSSTK